MDRSNQNFEATLKIIKDFQDPEERLGAAGPALHLFYPKISEEDFREVLGEMVNLNDLEEYKMAQSAMRILHYSGLVEVVERAYDSWLDDDSAETLMIITDSELEDVVAGIKEEAEWMKDLYDLSV